MRTSLLFSILLHSLVLLVWIGLFRAEQRIEPQKKLTWIDLETPKNEKNQQNEKRRIVQTEKGTQVETAKPDAYLGWQNQVVENQTVGKKQQASANSQPKLAQSKTSSPKKSTEATSTESKSLSHLGLPVLKKAIEQSAKNQLDSPEWATPGTRPEDFIRGMKESDRTALNTREYVFYGYFQRIRERLDRAWVPILRKRLMVYFHSGRHLASDMDHITKVLVILNETGEIVKVQMVSESGTRDLDEAAVSAFNQAGPFPNPPKGMIDTNKEIRIPWDFVLKT